MGLIKGGYYSSYGGNPKLGGWHLLQGLSCRSHMLWGLYWGHPIHGNCHIGFLIRKSGEGRCWVS